MRAKYIEERFKPWMIFGESADGTRVTIANIDGDIISSVLREEALCAIRDHNDVIDFLAHICIEFSHLHHDEFSRCYYHNQFKHLEDEE
jgi:hypothetical protein